MQHNPVKAKKLRLFFPILFTESADTEQILEQQVLLKNVERL